MHLENDQHPWDIFLVKVLLLWCGLGREINLNISCLHLEILGSYWRYPRIFMKYFVSWMIFFQASLSFCSKTFQEYRFLVASIQEELEYFIDRIYNRLLTLKGYEFNTNILECHILVCEKNLVNGDKTSVSVVAFVFCFRNFPWIL